MLLALSEFNFPLIMFISILEHMARNILTIVTIPMTPIPWDYITVLCAYGIHLYFLIYKYLELNTLFLDWTMKMVSYWFKSYVFLIFKNILMCLGTGFINILYCVSCSVIPD